MTDSDPKPPHEPGSVMSAMLDIFRKSPGAPLTLGDLGRRPITGRIDITLPAPTISATGTVHPPDVQQEEPLPVVMVGIELVKSLHETDEGMLIATVTPAWTRILRELASDPTVLSKLDWRQMEELIAGAYKAEGWAVKLTPRSGDMGRDIIATRDDYGAIRLLDQVKHYDPKHVVTANDVRAMFGVLSLDQKASKAVITTTSSFAPGVQAEFANVIPTRLDLRDGPQLLEWLRKIRQN